MGVRSGAVHAGGAASDAQPQAQARPKLLVVEDDPNIVELLSASLRFAGFEVSAVTSGAQAVAVARAAPPDLVVLDIGLPGMDGWEVLDRIRKDETTKSIPVVVLTAHAEEESRRRANEGGADAFVTKPFQPNDFRSTVLSLLE